MTLMAVPRAERDDDPSRRFDTLFVGRHRELADLKRIMARALSRPHPGVVGVYGEPGIGKTRLVCEWLAGSAESGVAVGIGRCRPGTNPLAPLAEALRDVLEAAPETAGLAAPLAVLDAGLLGDGPLGEGAVPASATAAALSEVLTALGRQNPVVLLLDDCHRAAPQLLDMIEHLAAGLTACRVVFLCVARPDLLEARPAWATRSSVLVTRYSPADCAEPVATYYERITARERRFLEGDPARRRLPESGHAAAARRVTHRFTSGRPR